MQNVTAQTKTWRKVKTVDGSKFSMIRTFKSNDNQLMAVVMDDQCKSHKFYANELKLA